jgi:hypothetical protein
MPALFVRHFKVALLLLIVCWSSEISADAQQAPAIESAVFEYQALAGNANNIDRQILWAINTAKHPNPKVVVATSADIGAIVQLETTLGQAAIIKTRLQKVDAALSSKTDFQCKSPINLTTLAVQTPPRGSLAPLSAGQLAGNIGNFFIANASAIQTLLATVASVGSVTETVAPAPGALNDTSLINAIAGDLRASGATPFVPSIYPPALAKQTFNQTIIGGTLDKLESVRNDMNWQANKRILSPQCQYTTGDKKGVKTVVNLAVINQMTTIVTAASALLDSFESQLFGGSPPATPPVAPAPAAPAAAPAPGTPAGGGQAPSGGQSPAGTQPPSGAGLPAAPAQPSAPSGTTLQQLLYADLTLQQLGATSMQPTISANNVYFVSVHSLESGGNTLTAAAFFGSRVFFSGGAVSIFSIFDGNAGTLLCSGVSYAYRGFVSQHQMQLGINDAQNPGLPPGTLGVTPVGTPTTAPDVLPPSGYYTSSCPRG